MKSYSEFISSLNEKKKGKKVKVPVERWNKAVLNKTGKRIRKEPYDFIKSLGPDDTVDTDVFDLMTGEILMKPGETKRKIGKAEAKKRDAGGYEPFDYTPYFPEPKLGKEWEPYYEMNDFYRIIEKSVKSKLDKESIKTLTDGDYDVNATYPAAIQRKDRKPFTSDDVHNIKMIAKYYSLYSPNIVFTPIVKKGMKTAHTQFYFN